MSAHAKAPAPLALPVGLWAGGMLLARILHPAVWLLLIPALTLCLLAWIFPRLQMVMLLLLMVLAGAMRYQSVRQTPSPLSAILQEKGSIRQTITFRLSKVFSAEEKRYEIKLYDLAGKRAKDKLIYTAVQPLQPGFWYRGIADITPITQDPILDIYPSHYAGKAYQLGRITRLSGTGYRDWIIRLRLAGMQNLDRKLGKNAGWAQGLLFSDTSAKYEYLEELTDSGIIHLIVVSGLHVWMLYLIVVSLLRPFMLRQDAELLFLPLILLFAALNNWAPSITRSIIMIGCGIIAHWQEKPLAGLQSLAVALFIITLVSPLQLFNIGLQLSFVAVLVIIHGVPRLPLFSQERLLSNPLLKTLDQALDALLTSVFVSLAIVPLTLHYFGRITFNGLIGNILGIPLIGILLPVSLLVLLTPSAWYLGKLFQLVYLALCQLWTGWISWCQDLPLKYLGLSASASVSWALVLIILWLFFLVRGRYSLALKTVLPLGAAAAVLLIFPAPASHNTEIYVFNSGVADCSLVRFADGKNLMLDTGGLLGGGYGEKLNQDSDFKDSWMQKKLLPWLRRQGVRQVDGLVISHLHSDHCGGMPALLKALKVKNIYVSDESSAQPVWHKLAGQGYFRHSQIHVISDTVSFAISGARLKFLHPDKGFYSENENNLSLVCRLDAGKARILFTGDIEQEAESYLEDKYPDELKADYLKVPHHGSKTSSSADFLSAVRPQEAWLTVSRRNRFHFPHPQTLQRYACQQIRLNSTAQGTLRKIIDTDSPK